MSEPEWLKKARAEGRVTESASVNLAALGLNSAKGELRPEEKKRKYRNQPVTVEGLRFDSKKEARRWIELSAIAKLGGIKNLRRQVRWDLVVNGIKVSHYTADFVYETLDGAIVVEDTKSEATAQDRSYAIRKRLMAALYGIQIREV